MTEAGRIAAAIALLEAVEGAGRRPADAVASAFFRERRFIGSGDRRAVSDRVWTVLRTRRRLGWWIARAGGGGGGEAASARLMVGASLLLGGGGWTMDGVDAQFSGGRFAPAPLAAAERAVLRRLAGGDTLTHPEMPEPVRFEMPDWVWPLAVDRFGGTAEAAREMAGADAPAPLDLRVNGLRGTREQAAAALAAEGIAAEPTPLSPWGLRVAGRRAVTTGPAFQSGLVEIQDEGSQVLAALAGAAPGMRVADYCAGAGGKTLAMAAAMANRGHIVACDVSAPRLDGAVRRLRRAGVHNAERHLLAAAGDKWAKRQEQKFDRVLVDAPCTGSGTWRRNPDARTRLAETDLSELLGKQAAILDRAAALVRPGGRLIYGTCSWFRAENEAQVDGFLERQPAFAILPLPRAWTLPGDPPCPGPFLFLTPARHGTDGFFGAVLERSAAA